MPFRLPIEYCPDKKKIFDNLYTDLELLEGESKGMYEHLLCPTTTLGKNILEQWSQYYTPNRKFLKDSQKFYDSLGQEEIDKQNTEKMVDIWDKVKNEDNFLEKYQYVEWDRIKWLNEYVPFLSFMSLYNLISPLFNLLLPLVMLLVPFFLLKIMKVPITMSTYKNILLQQIRNHSIGRLFTEFNFVSWDKRSYILISFGMYIFNIYQNIITCYHFYVNTRKIDEYFATIKKYIHYTVDKMNIVITKVKGLETYQSFLLDIGAYKDELCKLKNNWHFKPVLSSKGIMNIGTTMKQFYLIHSNKRIADVFEHTFKFNGYWDTIVGLHTNTHINNAKFKRKTSSLTNTFYPPLAGISPVKNSISMKKNIIVTGPNAAGKTTLLKTILLNVLFSQQVGKGFYDKANIRPYNFFHCYLNIPDTSARDSLFQAEARRCKEILTFIEDHPKEKHLCIFDELYSGTNHYEAVSSAYSYLNYISERKNITFLLTTHFMQLCNMLDEKSNIKNIQMETKIINNVSNYSYKIIDGISNIKGGICVLRKLNYPEKILKMTEETIRSL